MVWSYSVDDAEAVGNLLGELCKHAGGTFPGGQTQKEVEGLPVPFMLDFAQQLVDSDFQQSHPEAEKTLSRLRDKLVDLYE
ncbi:MAG: hypothetical protein WC768_01690 [Patescibacteria group bacterium]|jgi:hypothetical protein